MRRQGRKRNLDLSCRFVPPSSRFKWPRFESISNYLRRTDPAAGGKSVGVMGETIGSEEETCKGEERQKRKRTGKRQRAIWKDVSRPIKRTRLHLARSSIGQKIVAQLKPTCWSPILASSTFFGIVSSFRGIETRSDKIA